jgi:hypothetical protein
MGSVFLILTCGAELGNFLLKYFGDKKSWCSCYFEK